MKSKLVTLVFITIIISIGFIQPTDSFARSAKKHVSKSHIKKSRKKSHRTNRKNSALIQSSLEKLKNYYPEFTSDDIQLQQNVKFQPANFVSKESVFSNHLFRARLVTNINSWLGTPYVYGGHSRRGVDCSDFVACMFEETFGVRLNGSAATQSTNFQPIKNSDSLKFGDLIFFKGTNMRSKRVGHVGIYIGNGLFAHSSTGRGVIYTLLDEDYYTQRFLFGGRFFKETWSEMFPPDEKYSVENHFYPQVK